MFTEIRRRNEEIRRHDEETRTALSSFNPDARIQPRVVDKIAEEMAINSFDELPFNPDARIVF